MKRELLKTFASGEQLWLEGPGESPSGSPSASASPSPSQSDSPSGSSSGSPSPEPPPSLPAGVIKLAAGAHVFIDPYFMEQPAFTRLVKQPKRFGAAPLLGGKDWGGSFHVSNYNCCVLRDPDSGLRRMWYLGSNPAYPGTQQNALSTSWDGITWTPPQWLDTPGLNTIGNNALGNVVDNGPAAGSMRYASVVPDVDANPAGPRWTGVLWVSPDGVTWRKAENNPVVPNPYGELYTIFGASLLHRWNVSGLNWVDKEGRAHAGSAATGFTRCIGQTGPLSADSKFAPSRMLFQPNASESGETQFYYVSNVVRVGELWLAAMGVLREDLLAAPAPAGPQHGMGYTTLIWSRDGLNWDHYDGYDPVFFTPNPDSAAWDHAVSWISSIEQELDGVNLYYGGYHLGHKFGSDRSIGAATLKRDRFVSRANLTSTPVVLRTKLIGWEQAAALTVNSTGHVRVRVVDEANVPLPGFGWADWMPLDGDHVEAPLHSASANHGNWPDLAGRPLKLEFELTTAELFAFYLR